MYSDTGADDLIRGKAQARNDFDLVTAIHESELVRRLDPSLEPSHKFEVTFEADGFTEEKFKLFQNYQQHVHHDLPHKITRTGFTRFLCASPLRNWKTRTVNGKEQSLGSFHQCYRLDGRLIAMSVLDLLPHCVSGVYFIYHSDFEKFSLGKISALRETALALEDGYQYYYMGYYIHTCTKMRYKNDYKPQYLLDLETMEWNKLDDDIWKLLDDNHYLSVSLARAPTPPSPKRNVFGSAQEAAATVEEGTSLFEIEFAGMMTEEELEDSVDIDRISVKVRKDVVKAEASLSIPLRYKWIAIHPWYFVACTTASPT
jgi:arginine-tRNA-protein transferase